jgi:alkanesulfonate monooxygenase SsuD/methylene tetrahydromethanopterin reductase-like flavin-dependent oxidoreductase (luciferase family)
MGWNNDPDDVYNREVFEEQVAIFKAATSNEEFSFRGKHYVLPPDGLQFRDEPVTRLPLVPRPLNVPVRIYQAVSSQETLQFAAREGHIGVFWQVPRVRLIDSWRRYGDMLAAHHQRQFRPGEDRMLVVNMHMAETHAAAFERARPGHDELRKLLWPNLVNRNPALGNRPPYSLEETVEQGSWLVGSISEVREELVRLTDEIGLEYLTIFPHLPGLTRADTLEQLRLFQAEVMPALREASARVAVTT